MEELKISKANAFKAFKSADKSGKKLLTDLFGQDVLSEKITDRVKSYEDACLVESFFPLSVEAFTFLPETDRESALAHHQLTIIARALNEGWTPDWDDSNQYKYYPYFIWGGSGLGFSFNGYRLRCLARARRFPPRFQKQGAGRICRKTILTYL